MPAMKSALIATDFSVDSHAAGRRALSIAKETGLRGALVHVLPGSLPSEVQVQSASRAQAALAISAGEMKRAGLELEPRLASGEIAEEIARASREFDLVIAGGRAHRIFTDYVLGRTWTRLVRQCVRPTLIVKRPLDAPYRRVVAGVDFSETSLAAVLCATELAPKADFNLVHAFEPELESSMRLGGATEDAIYEYRRQAREKAMAQMAAFTGRLPLPSGQVWSTTMLGYPTKLILDSAEQTEAELIALGKHAAGALEQFFIGSVALQVLEMAKCDVLVVPEKAS